MSNLIKHAERELKLLGLFNKDSVYNGKLAEATMELIKVFSDQGHSGMSANIVSSLFNNLSRFENLAPLTFEDDEWVEYEEGKFQNKRRSSVFKDGKNGEPYFLDAYEKVAVFPDGHKSSWRGTLILENGFYITKCYIKDPINMPTIKIELKAYYYAKNPCDWNFEPAKEDQLEELRKYYYFEIKKGELKNEIRKS